MLALRNRKRTGGLVHHDDPGLRAERGGDLDQLLLPGGEFADGPVDIDVRLDLREHLPGSFPHQAAIQPACGVGKFSKAKILRHGQVRAEGQLLVHDGDSKSAGRQWIGGFDAPAFEDDFTGIGDMDSGKDFSQRALTRAVLAHQRMAAAGGDIERHAVQRLDAGKRLGDVAEREEGHACGIAGPVRFVNSAFSSGGLQPAGSALPLNPNTPFSHRHMASIPIGSTGKP